MTLKAVVAISVGHDCTEAHRAIALQAPYGDTICLAGVGSRANSVGRFMKGRKRLAFQRCGDLGAMIVRSNHVNHVIFVSHIDLRVVIPLSL